MDAVIAVKELGLTFMKVKRRLLCHVLSGGIAIKGRRFMGEMLLMAIVALNFRASLLMPDFQKSRMADILICWCKKVSSKQRLDNGTRIKLVWFRFPPVITLD